MSGAHCVLETPVTLRSGKDWLGNYFREIAKFDDLTHQEIVALAKQRDEGDEAAIEKIVVHSLRLAVGIAKRYRGRGLPFQDLISEANMCLISCAKRFDPTRGVKFSTYAYKAMERRIGSAIANSRLLRFPGNIIQMAYKVERYLHAKKKGILDPVPYQEIISETGLRKGQVERIFLYLRMKIFDQEVFEGSSDFWNYVEKQQSTVTNEIEYKYDLKADLLESLKILTAIERAIIVRRFGLEGEFMSLKELAEMFSLSGERIRQLEQQALHKLKNSSCGKILRQYL